MPAVFAYLLDADDELGEELDMRERFTARQQITVRVLHADVGPCPLEPWLATVGRGPGLLILDGVLAADTRLTSRTTTELLGRGDLLQPAVAHPDELIERVETWRVLSHASFAMLDGEFADRARPWPRVTQVLLRRAERRAEDLGVLRAISCEPRLEMRLVLLLWHLAGRWGRVEPSGIHLTLPLTHRLLGQLVAAERPSISHALARLSRARMIEGAAEDLHLRGSLAAQLSALHREPRRRPAAAELRASL
ncbi:MAG TPA: helix-turn-helix domain-containing protein [Solirubrobacteraceae bacterium]|jgi:CRP/FNR family cyclic AMP-dependent transcriptional regulator|nr:helix-turn-helix domain-containing protein [Solirubrobacteraceae bacterium]